MQWLVFNITLRLRFHQQKDFPLHNRTPLPPAKSVLQVPPTIQNRFEDSIGSTWGGEVEESPIVLVVTFLVGCTRLKSNFQYCYTQGLSLSCYVICTQFHFMQNKLFLKVFLKKICAFHKTRNNIQFKNGNVKYQKSKTGDKINFKKLVSIVSSF